MNRDELIAVGAMAIRSHTPEGLCPLCHQDARDVVDAVEPLIRADEREQMLDIVGSRGGIRDLTLYNLRARVLALSGSPNSALDWVLRVDVLALLDGADQ